MSSFFDYSGTRSGGGAGGIHEPTTRAFWPIGSHTDWQRLLAHTQTLRWRAGETVIIAGRPNQSVFIVASGRVVHSSTPDTAWSEGEAVGIRSFFSGLPVGADIIAATDVEALRLTRDELDVIAAREADLAHLIVFELGRLLSLEVDR